jgi:hypothetical protein
VTINNDERLPSLLLKRKAMVYIRQSTQTQIQINVKSKRRQYDLVQEATRLGFRDMEVIADDLGARRAEWWLDRVSSARSRCCVQENRRGRSGTVCGRLASLETVATGPIFLSFAVLSKPAQSTSTVCAIRAGQTAACCWPFPLRSIPTGITIDQSTLGCS